MSPAVLDLARVIDRGGFPFCSACRHRLQRFDQWRCPWSTCRRWFRDASAVAPTPPERFL